jgi:hypothetical protein
MENPREELRKQGYYARNLWQVADVRTWNPNISDEDALELLHDVLNSETVVRCIWEVMQIKMDENEK